MNLKQQAENVAKAGRFGDSMILHVNPAEMQSLRKQLPITKNPKTGQDEAFLPFLAPLLGQLAGGALLTGVGGLSSLAAGAIGGGLAQWAATGDFQKGLLAGVSSYGVGRALQGASAAAEGAKAADAATQSALQDTAVKLGVDTPGVTTGLTASGDFAVNALNPNVAAEMGSKAVQGTIDAARTGATQAGMEAAASQTPLQNLQNAFTNPQGNVDLMTGAGNVAGALANDPLAYIPTAIGMGGTSIMETQEAYEDYLGDLSKQRAENEKRNQEEYEKQIKALMPMIGGRTAGFQEGGQPFFGYEDFYNDPYGDMYGGYDPTTGIGNIPGFDDGVLFPPGLGGGLIGSSNVGPGFPGNPLSPSPFYEAGFSPEFLSLPGLLAPGFTNYDVGPFNPIADPSYQQFYRSPFDAGFPVAINPYASFNPADIYNFLPQGLPTPPPVTPPPIMPPPPIQVPPIDPPPDEKVEPPSPDPVEPPVTQPGGPGPIDTGKQPPVVGPIASLPSQEPPVSVPVEPPVLPPIGGPGGIIIPEEYDSYINNLIQTQLAQIQQPDLSGFVTQDALAGLLPQDTTRSDAEINELISQRLSGLPQPQQFDPTGLQNQISALSQQISSFPQFDPSGLQSQIAANQAAIQGLNIPGAFDPSGLQGQIDILSGQLAGLPDFSSFARSSDIVPFDPSGLQGQLSGLQGQISGLQDQFAGFQPFDPSGLQGQIGQIQGQIGSLPDFSQFAMLSDLPSGFDPSGLQGQISGLQNQIAGIQPFDPSGLQSQIGGLQNQFGQLQGQLAGLPDFSQFALSSQIPQAFDPSELQAQILANQQAISGFQPFNPAGLQNQIGQLQGQFAALPDFSQFARTSDIVPQFDPTNLQGQIGQLQGQFGSLPDFSQFALQSQIPQMPDMSQFALASQIPQMPNMSNFVTQQGLASALNPYALQSQIPMMPDLSGFAPMSAIPDVSNFITNQQLANTMQYYNSPYRFGMQEGTTPEQAKENSEEMRRLLMRRKAMEVMVKTPFDDVEYDQILEDLQNENVTGLRQRHSMFNMFIQNDIDRKDFIELLKEREKIMSEPRNGKANGEQMQIGESAKETLNMDAVLGDPNIAFVIEHLRGLKNHQDIVDAFIEKYGSQAYLMVRDMVLKQGNNNRQTEGMVQGESRGGMTDDIAMNIGQSPEAAISQGEYIIAADVVSDIGDGDSASGARKLDKMMTNIRQEKNGKSKQPAPLKKSIEEYMT